MALFVLCVACLTVFVNCLLKQCAIFFRYVCYFVVECYGSVECGRKDLVLCWIYRVWSFKECVCCACDPSVHLDVLSMGFVCVSGCRKLSPHLGV